MNKILVLLATTILLTACSIPEKSADIEEQSQMETETDIEKNNVEKKEVDEKQVETIGEDDANDGDMYIKAGILTVGIPSVYNDEGNFAKKHTMTEYMKMAEEQGIVRFAMDDFPVRAIVSDDQKVTNITNFADAYIDITNNVAYQIDKSEIPSVYKLFLSAQPEDLIGTPASDYRTWEEATNLERGIMQIVILTAPLLNDIGYIIENEEWDHPVLNNVQNDFFTLGSPTVLLPAPQSVTDMVMYDNMMMISSLWERIGRFENIEENKEEFIEVYQKLRSETNNLFARINYVLTQ
ncbi:hypothetical protein [Sporosarcina sp. USHLN248]|uniref:hypothetical protein n=1 Tax=Sporosarcina sp. USHLN248 TaxID=3081300 RepID=UPI00301928D1